MKKILLIILPVLICASCNDFLEEKPKGQIIGDAAITNIEGLEGALNAAYHPLTYGFETGFASPSAAAIVMGSDDLTTHPASNKQSFRDMDRFTVSSLNDRSARVWKGLYLCIQRANNVLVNYEGITGDQAALDRIVGEAYFLRGFSYFWLVRLYGNVPVLTDPELTDDKLTISPSDPAEIYELIVSDLQMAESLLPEAKKDAGRSNKGSAKSFLAEVYLTLGGWPIKDESKYALAAAKAKEVIDNSASYGFNINTPLSILWSGDWTHDRDAEEIFALQKSVASDNANSLFGAGPTAGEDGGWDDYFAEINFFLNYPDGIRKDLTFKTMFGQDSSIPWQSTATKHPYYKKFYVVEGAEYQTSMPVQFMRFAQILLTYAEAQARADGTPNADAYAALNAVRERAGLTALDGLSKNDFIEAVINERSWEFAGEFPVRWFDLVRLERVAQANTNKHPDDLSIIGQVSDATHEGYYLPIPGNDVAVNPNLN